MQHQRERIELDLADVELAAVFPGDELGRLRVQQARHAEEAEQRVGDEQREQARDEDDPPARELHERHHTLAITPYFAVARMGPTAYTVP